MAILGIYMKFMGCKVCEVHVMLKHHNKPLDETIILGLKVMKRTPPQKTMDKTFQTLNTITAISTIPTSSTTKNPNTSTPKK